MKILHLPVNWASQASATVRSLRDIGLDARGLIVSSGAAVIQSHDGLELLAPIASKQRPLKHSASLFRYCRKLFAAMHWADVLHWHGGSPTLPGGLDLRWAQVLRKPGIVEFWGSDIRIPDVEAADNSYYAALGSDYEYRETESHARSRHVQARFSKAGFECMIPCKSMLPYVQDDLFPEVHLVRQRIVLSDYRPTFPEPDRKRLVVVHSSSAPACKGTPTVLAAVAYLQEKFDFDFRLIQNIPRRQALEMIGAADMFLDQFVLGGHGLAALEGMALGKPVVCYIKPSMITQYPPDLPIVNANQDNLADMLAELLKDGHLRQELGRRGRTYVEKHHDASKIAHQLKGIYEKVVGSRVSHV